MRRQLCSVKTIYYFNNKDILDALRFPFVYYKTIELITLAENMTQELESFMDKVISVITGDGRNIVGMMKGFDQTINVVLEDSHERVYSESAGVAQIPLGLYILRGDNIAVIGEIDPDLDRRLDLDKVLAAPLPPIWLAS
jgi:U6 snRNA-associated Sm-like protein LSm8